MTKHAAAWAVVVAMSVTVAHAGTPNTPESGTIQHLARDPDRLVRAAKEHLELARHDLKLADHDFDGHRAKALDLTEAALKSVHKALRENEKSSLDSAGDAVRLMEDLKRKEQHPLMRSALKNLTLALDELTTAPHDYDGHRSKAVGQVKDAIAQVRAGLKSN